MILQIAFAAGSIALALAPTASKAAAAKARHPLAKRQSAPKTDPLDNLVAALWVNSTKADANLWDTCLSSNIKSLLWALRKTHDKILVTKGEFETQAEFSVRRDGIENALSKVGQLVVCQDLKNNMDVPFKYDPESETFTGSFSPTLRADLDFKKTGAYTSKTRMGVKATVQSFLDVEYQVDMANGFSMLPDCLRRPSSYGNITFSMAVSRTNAPIVKQSGYLVFIGYLKHPYFTEGVTLGEPTLDHPKDIYELRLEMKFAPTSVRVVMPDGSEPFRCNLPANTDPAVLRSSN